ncbi:MAG: LamG domain-containing protein [Candidatus Micrarchaeota archaeon]|nr:LamG domain-containing protein [Candidatus Micrarchaeota archaeon]
MRLKGARLQSAMEYLMTYGWAILAIAIVMVSLYSLGIFNIGSLQPTATPGSCQVLRTAAQTSLAGQCASLIPKYVGQFNGANAYSQVPYFPQVNPSKFTVVIWTYVKGSQGSYRSPMTSRCVVASVNQGYMLYASDTNQWKLQIGCGTGCWGGPAAGTVTLNNWVQVAGTYNGTAAALYVNGTNIASTNVTYVVNPSCVMRIGAGYTESNPSYYFNGSLANLQIYNTTLSAADIKALYQEGIGGAPINVRNLTAWYPLNGNANDYSGGFRNGNVVNIVWNANWESGYSSPKT